MSIEWNWPGARWWKIDFHAHTPESDDYGKGPDQAVLKQRTPQEWLLDYMRAGIDCVVVTDHNTGAFIDTLKSEIARLEAENHVEYRKLYIFPGLEISVNGGIHVLSVFDLDKSTSDIDSLLGAVGFRGQKGTGSTCTEESFIKVIGEIVKAGAVAIPAHVDQDKGLFKLTGITLEQALDISQILAVETHDISLSKPQTYIDKKLSWTEVLGSDAHHPTGSAGHRFVGSHYTWVKMSVPSLDGIRLALLDGPLSIKRSDQFQADPNSHGHLAIESVTVAEAKYMGRGVTSFEVRFNPWLNTIIGGRGTGKSTLLEFIRLILRRDGELPDSLSKDFEKYRTASISRTDDGLLTSDAKLVVKYRKDGALFRVQWNLQNTLEQIFQEAADGVLTASTGDIQQRFPVRIYSQKQIYELSKKPQALLQIVNDSADINHREWIERRNELQTRFLSLRAQSREIEVGLSEETRIKGELEDVLRKLIVFEQAGHADVLKNYQRRLRQLHAIDQWQKLWADCAEQIRKLAQGVCPPPISPDVFQLEDEIDVSILNDIEAVRQHLNVIADTLNLVATEADGVVSSWKQSRDRASWSVVIKEALGRYEELRTQLAQADVGDPSEYGQLVNQCQTLEERLRSFTTRRGQLIVLKSDTQNCLNEIKLHRRELTRRRVKFISEVLDGNKYVSITVLPYGNSENVEGEFRELINRSQGGYEKIIGTIDGEDGLLSQLYHGYLPNEVGVSAIEGKLEQLKIKINDIRNGTDKTVTDGRFVTHAQGVTPEQLDRLDCWFPDDSLEVRYSIRPGEFRPVHQGSPGQRTVALLAFLLSYGDEPLILDQPEDDLDNHLIYDLIVTQLREIKQRRQVIIVTHNANIVVNGDAEQVVALNVASGQSQKICEGSLQEMKVRDEICRVMEGGEKAFDLRYRRIRAKGNCI